MTRDFTFEKYEELITASLEAGYDHLTVREYLTLEELPERFMMYRHDVDRKPENALAMAQLEASLGISSTYYFRTVSGTFDPVIIREIESLGHEIGYHYEDLDRASGDVDRAHDSFSTELDRLREVATVDTVCMHGNPLTRHDNREMWTDGRRFEEYGLLGEAYLSMDFADVTYFSDTGRTWQDGALKIKDHTMGDGEKHVQATTTDSLIDLISTEDVPRLCLLAHPNRWAEGTLEYVLELTKDTGTNVGKRLISIVSA